jgi:threonine synthase
MLYYSTKNKANRYSFRDAALGGLAPDGGLYIPAEIPRLPASVISSLETMSYKEIAYEAILPFVKDDAPAQTLAEIVDSAYNFDAHLVDTGLYSVLELFHGPTAAFKDFGARFMARIFSYFRRGEDKPLTILTATSGDTGGAVADGFFGVEGISVTVLYPKGRVTPLQEKQIAGLGGNINAIAVEGSFDDCQRLVKEAFVNGELKKRLVLSSANSINIARLIPQAVYYIAGAGKRRGVTYSVPSGNFGNLTAGIYAQKMGAPISSFIAATNINKTVPDYLESGVYENHASKATISNAMDVGAPSNFERLAAHWTLAELRSVLKGVWVDDDETRETIKKVHSETGYALDPHGAVGWKAALKLKLNKTDNIAVLETAHPAKFAETVEPLIGKIPIPPALESAMKRDVKSVTIKADIGSLIEKLASAPL